MRQKGWTNTGKKDRGRCILSLFLAIFFLCSGCSFGNSGEQSAESVSEELSKASFKLYTMNEERTKVVGSHYELTAETTQEQIAELLTELEAVLWIEEEKTPLLEKNPIQGFAVNEIGVLTLYFAPDYVPVGDTTAVLRRASLVKTLCQLEEVSSVEMYIGTQPMMLANGKPLGMLKAEDFIDSTGAETEFYQEAQVVVYFASPDGKMLREAVLRITYDGKISTERLVLNQLLDGPISEEQLAVLPKETVLNKVSIKDGICYADFNEAFLKGREGVAPEVTIYAIVNSLTELSNVYKVQFLINGESRKSYPGLSADFSSAFERNLEIIEGEQ